MTSQSIKRAMEVRAYHTLSHSIQRNIIICNVYTQSITLKGLSFQEKRRGLTSEKLNAKGKYLLSTASLLTRAFPGLGSGGLHAILPHLGNWHVCLGLPNYEQPRACREIEMATFSRKADGLVSISLFTLKVTEDHQQLLSEWSDECLTLTIL